jgi:hypothetical protein
MSIQTFNTRQILVKLETTSGVDSAPVGATDSMLSYNGNVSIEADKLERDIDRPFLGANPFLLVHKRATVEFEIDLIGNSTVGNSAPISPILKACGMAETLVGGTSASYTFISSAFQSATVYFYIGPLRCTMVYSMGTLEINQEIKSFNRGKVTLTGVITNSTLPTENVVSGVTLAAFQTPPAVEMETWFTGFQDSTMTAMPDPVAATGVASGGGSLAAGTYLLTYVGKNANGFTKAATNSSGVVATANQQITWTLTAVTGATSYDVYGGTVAGQLTYLGTTATTSFIQTGAVAPNGTVYPSNFNTSQYRHVQAVKLMLAFNNKVTIHEAAELRAVYIMDRSVTGSVQIFEPSLPAYNPWTDATNLTTRQFISQVGYQPGKICRITCPIAQVEYAKLGNKDDAITFEIPFSALPGVTTGNDELSLQFF